MITQIKKMITVIRKGGFNDYHRNQNINHCNLFSFRNSKGQSIIEYVTFITVVVMALLAMQIYLKRGVQGKIYDMASYIGSESYVPETTTSSFSSNRSVAYESDYAGGVSTTTIILDQTNTSGVSTAIPESVN